MTRHHAALILTAVLVGTLAAGIIIDHREPTQQNWLDVLLAGLQAVEV